MKKFKITFKILVFLLIFLFILYRVQNVFVLKGTKYGGDLWSFYNKEKNSLDVIYFGSSQSYASFSPEIIDPIVNINSYNFATQQQPVDITYYYMVEALKTQHPKYMVVEIRMFSYDAEYLGEGTVRTALDKMNMSKNKIDAINSSVKKFSDRISYYINILKYHSRYNEISYYDILQGINKSGMSNTGYIGIEGKNDLMINNGKIPFIKDKKNLNEKNFKYLQNMINLSHENDFELIFIKAPSLITKEEQLLYNKVFEIASNNNIKYIDYNQKFKELGLTNGDFYDELHLSKSGSEKLSRNFADYLKEIL